LRTRDTGISSRLSSVRKTERIQRSSDEYQTSKRRLAHTIFAHIVPLKDPERYSHSVASSTPAHFRDASHAGVCSSFASAGFPCMDFPLASCLSNAWNEVFQPLLSAGIRSARSICSRGVQQSVHVGDGDQSWPIRDFYVLGTTRN
jgi:hypothetical protein